MYLVQYFRKALLLANNFLSYKFSQLFAQQVKNVSQLQLTCTYGYCTEYICLSSIVSLAPAIRVYCKIITHHSTIARQGVAEPEPSGPVLPIWCRFEANDENNVKLRGISKVG